MNEPFSQLIFLGTGSGVPSPDRASPALLLKLADANVLIDLGPGTLRQLSRISVSIAEIDYIFLTHLHLDHSADLAPFLFGNKYPPFLNGRRPFHLLAGTDIEPFHEKLKALYGHWIELPEDIFRILPLPQDGPCENNFSSFSLRSSPVPHSSSSLGYRITLHALRKVLVFSGDSDYSTSLVQLAKDSDLLVLECSFPEGEKVNGHLTPSLAGRIAREAGVKELILTHFYPECQGRDIIGPCSREYSGPIRLAEDFLSISI
jgi:ribonuclease BN (tRNA processing enzyme)